MTGLPGVLPVRWSFLWILVVRWFCGLGIRVVTGVIVTPLGAGPVEFWCPDSSDVEVDDPVLELERREFRGAEFGKAATTTDQLSAACRTTSPTAAEKVVVTSAHAAVAASLLFGRPSRFRFERMCALGWRNDS